MPSLTNYLKSLALTAAVALVGGGLFLYSGIYPVGADVPHNRLTYWLLETARERSIARAAADIEVPENITSVDRLLAGGADYNDMCAACHLKPGTKESDFTQGLYPVPPNLTRNLNRGAAEADMLQRQFWIIKHGIKASGMPAWGPTHGDQRIWDMVAFLQKLPTLDVTQYQIITARRDGGQEDH